jgi:hypothetical protein
MFLLKALVMDFYDAIKAKKGQNKSKKREQNKN